MEWAVPVRSDELGAHLEVYERSLPRLLTLRLCRRYGQGPDVYITGMPPELLLQVEEFVIAADRKPGWSEWQDALYHYESRCHPKDHFDEPYKLFPSWMIEEGGNATRCDDCVRSGLRDSWDDCDKQRDYYLNELIDNDVYERQEFEHECKRRIARWRELIGMQGAPFDHTKVIRFNASV